MWSAGCDGAIDENLVAARDREFHVSSAKLRELRGQTIGFEVPRVRHPKSCDQPGRQWTNEGEDKPTPRG
jgi:hypothetical protein